MLSAAVHRSSRDVNIMKEKLIFSGKSLSLCANWESQLAIKPQSTLSNINNQAVNVPKVMALKSHQLSEEENDQPEERSFQSH